MYTCILVFFTVFLKNRNNISKIKRSKVTDYAALSFLNTGCLPVVLSVIIQIGSLIIKNEKVLVRYQGF